MSQDQRTRTTHTPGPWYVGAQNDALFITAGRAPSPSNDYPNHDADRTVIASVSQENESANASVLAAAPELLAAAKSAREWLAALALAQSVNGAESIIAALHAAIQNAESQP